MEDKNIFTEQIIACCFKVHSELGPGFSEKIYHNALKVALEEVNLKYETEKDFPVYFHDKKAGSLRLDLIVEDGIVVEVKAFNGNVPEVFKYQVISYLKITGLHIGLIVNFGNKSCKIKRVVF